LSIDTTFQPKGSSLAIVSGAPAQLNGGQSNQIGVTTFRVVNTTLVTAVPAPTRISWGTTAATTPVPAAPGPSSLLLAPNGVTYIEVPPNVFFNVAALGTVEIMGGQGGCGG
jgi:hypothetical protein